MKSRVALLKLKKGDDVRRAVRRAMRMAKWERYVSGKKIFLKINSMNHNLLPGTNTSPWVFEGVLQELTEKMPKADIAAGDANLCSCKNVDRAWKVWGYRELAEKYGARFVNLSRERSREVEIGGRYLKKMNIPETVLEADSIVTIPVMKTHNWSVITASLKNQWGCMPRSRHLFHLHLHDTIADINLFLRPRFSVIDGTVCLEGTGPRTGKPKICNIIMASPDLVAADSAAARFMGFDPEKIPYIKRGDEKGLGTMDYKIIGDPLKPDPFQPSGDTIVTYMHKKLRFSFLEPLLFRTWIFNILSRLAIWYNTKYWYNTKGKKYANEIIKTRYGAQFRHKELK